MSDFNEFTCFALLAQELQDLIWSHSFRPQLITLHYTSPNNASPLSVESISTPPSPSQLEPIDTPAPSAFSVCRASRAIAQSKGYKTWRMTRPDGKIRDLLWDPLIDTVLFAGPGDNHFNLFVQQFPAHASEIRNLALPHWYWDASFATKTNVDGGVTSIRGSPELFELLKNPSRLQKMFVIVDEEFFESEVKSKTGDQFEFWSARGCFGRGFYAELKIIRRRYAFEMDSFVSPKVSAAWNFDMILCGEDVELPKCLFDSLGAIFAERRVWVR